LSCARKKTTPRCDTGMILSQQVNDRFPLEIQHTCDGKVSKSLVGVLGIEQVVDNVNVYELTTNDWRSFLVFEVIQSSRQFQGFRVTPLCCLFVGRDIMVIAIFDDSGAHVVRSIFGEM
jgi:hypothetical protein